MLKPCKEWNERLSAYLDGEDDTTERLVVLRHLESCPACRAAAEILRCDSQDVSAALGARGAGEGFTARVMAEVAITPMGEPAEPAPRRLALLAWLAGLNRGQRGALILATASVLLLIVVIGTNLENAGVMPFRQRSANNPQTATAPNHSLRYLQPGPATTGAADRPHEAGIAPGQAAGERMASGPAAEAPSTIIARKSLAPQPSSATTAPSPAAPAGKPAPSAPPPPTSQPTIIPPELNYGLVDKLMIAYTAELSLRTKTVDRAMGRAELLFGKYDGFVLNTQYDRDEKGNATAVVNGRVPAGKLGQLLVELDGLGELQARIVNGEDLTAKQLEQIEQLGDLALKQQFLSKIESRDNRYSVESQREAVRSKGTGLRVDEYKLKNRVTLANVTVNISSPPVKKPKPNPAKTSAQKSYRGLRAFGMWILSAILIPLGIWSPVWAPLMIVGVVLRRRVLRRRGVVDRSGTVPSQRE
ncbi:MAG: DUF4349 domain-containing protein [Armatimonadota bacterium]